MTLETASRASGAAAIGRSGIGEVMDVDGVIHLELGEPDFPTRPPLIDAIMSLARPRRSEVHADFSMGPDFAPRFASAQAIMKTALNLQGLPGGYPRPPYLPLTDEETERVRTHLGSLGLLPAPDTDNRTTNGRGAIVEQQP